MLQPSQLQALIQLTGSGRMSQPMQAALHDVFCVDTPDEHAVIAARHGVSVRGFTFKKLQACSLPLNNHTLRYGTQAQRVF